MSRRRVVAQSVAVFVMLALGGCTSTPVAAPPPTPVTVPASPTPTPTAPAEPDSVSAPSPYWGFDCSDLVEPARLSTQLGVEVTPVADRGEHLGRRDHGPSTYHYRQLGGLDCAWTNGRAERHEPGYIGLEILLLPDSTRGWGWASQAIAGATEIDWHCGGSHGCTIQRLVRETWIVVELSSGTPDAVAAPRPLVEDYLARTSEAIESAVGGEPPSNGGAAGPYSTDACEAVITSSQIAAIYGRELVAIGVDGPWTIGNDAERRAAVGCHYSTDRGMEALAMAGLSWMPDAEWAWHDARPEGEPVHVRDGRPADESALDCSEEFCELNVLVGTTWIEWTMFPIEEGPDPRVLAPALVEAFVATTGA